MASGLLHRLADWRSSFTRAVAGLPTPLWAILALALALRVVGIGFGLPYPESRPDESTLVNLALGILQGGLNPHFFNYGTLFPQLLAALYGGMSLLGIGGPAGDLGRWIEAVGADPAPLLLAGRLVSALAGAVTVIPVFLIARRLSLALGASGESQADGAAGLPTEATARADRMGLVAALFLAVAYLHVRDSHFLTTDVLQALFLTLSLERLSAAAAGDSTLWAWAMAGLWGGAAMGTKYAGLLILPAGAMLFLVMSRSPSTRPDPRGLPALLLAFGLAFLASTPFALFDFPTFWDGFRYELFDHGGVPSADGPASQPGWWFHLRFTLPIGVGWGMLVLAVAGIGSLRKARRGSLLVLALLFVPALYYYSAGQKYLLFVRYMVPLVPMVAALAAVGLDWLIRRTAAGRAPATVVGAAAAVGGSAMSGGGPAMAVGGPTSKGSQGGPTALGSESRVAALVLVAGIGLVAIPNLRASTGLNALFQQESSWTTAANWLDQSVPVGDTVHTRRFGVSPGLRPIQTQLDSMAPAPDSTPNTRKSREHQLAQGRAAFWRQADPMGGWVHLWEWVPQESPDGEGWPRWIVVARSPLWRYHSNDAGVERALDQAYEVAFIAFGIGPCAIGVQIDQQDEFPVPLTGFDSATGPGPDIVVYRRRESGTITGPGVGSDPPPTGPVGLRCTPALPVR